MICPYCRTENAAGATRCAACTSWMVDRPPVRDWVRPREGRVLVGVCRGLADRFAIPPTVVRLVFLVSILFGGWGILAYIALWIAMPLEQLALPPAQIERREPAQIQPPA